MPNTPSKGSVKPAATPANITQDEIDLHQMVQSMNPQQRNAYDKLCAGENIFLTGEGGSGKTYVTIAFLLWCKIKGKSVGKMAPTGIAALNIGGVTMHRAFRLPVFYTAAVRSRSVSFDVIVMDEVSMARSDIFTHCERSMAGETGKPWGGAQVLCVGDFYQIAPVVKATERVVDSNDDSKTISVRNALKQDFGGVFAFQTDAWEQARIETVELLTNNRIKSKDEDNLEYVHVLNKIRNGTATQADLKLINRNIQPEPPAESLVVCFTNAECDRINEERLEAIIGKQYTSEMTVENERNIKESDYCVPKTLKLKVGARVMLQINDQDDRFKNGSVGEVVEIDTEKKVVHVRLTEKEGNKLIYVGKNEWEIKDLVDCYKVPDDSKRGFKYVPKDDIDIEEYEKLDDQTVYHEQATIASYTQYPLKLAWAITAHKSQGQTIDCPLHLQMDGKLRNHGLFYVAVSRATDINNLSVGKLVRVRDIVVDPLVTRFMNGTMSLQIPEYAEKQFHRLAALFTGIQESTADDDQKEAVLEAIDGRILAWERALKTLK